MEPSIEQRVLAEVARLGLAHEVVPCDPSEADTAVFCERHGYPVAMAANALVVRTQKPPFLEACCVVPGTHRLDVNRTVRERFGGARASFARPEEMRALTGMEVGGVTPFCLPAALPLWLAAALDEQPLVIVGTGGRTSKLILAPQELARLPGAVVVEGLSLPRDGRPALPTGSA